MLSRHREAPRAWLTSSSKRSHSCGGGPNRAVTATPSSRWLWVDGKTNTGRATRRICWASASLALTYQFGSGMPSKRRSKRSNSVSTRTVTTSRCPDRSASQSVAK